MSSPSSRAPVSHVDTTTPEFLGDPAVGYERTRDQADILWVPSGRSFLLTRYSDSVAALRDTRLSQDYVGADWEKISSKLNRDYSSVLTLFTYMPVVFEGRTHARLRRILASAVAPYAVGRAATIDARVENTLDPLRDAAGFDIVTDFAGHLMFNVMCDFMRAPAADRQRLRPLATMSWALDELLPVKRRDEFERKLREHLGYLRDFVENRAEHEGDNLVASLLRALPADVPDRIEATSYLLAVILLMGNDAVGACISFAVRRLLSDVAGRRIPQARWGSISDDAIRFAAPVDPVSRKPQTDIEIAGCPIAEGERIIVSPLCANHDPVQFGAHANGISPDARQGVGLSFGAGRHVCVGNRLSRAIVKSAFAGLAKLPPMQLSGPAVPGGGRVVRSLSSLPVTFVNGCGADDG